jgi:hypothetical protein
MASLLDVAREAKPLAGNIRRSSKRPLRRAYVVVVAFYVLLLLPSAHAQESVVNLDPAQTKIDFTLGDVLHTVRRAFKLKSGEIRFDPITGKADGAVIVDATRKRTKRSSRARNFLKSSLFRISGREPSLRLAHRRWEFWRSSGSKGKITK